MKETGVDEPCIRIKEENLNLCKEKIWYANKVTIKGEVTIKQSPFDSTQPNKPFICIETFGPLEWE